MKLTENQNVTPTREIFLAVTSKSDYLHYQNLISQLDCEFKLTPFSTIGELSESIFSGKKIPDHIFLDVNDQTDEILNFMRKFRQEMPTEYIGTRISIFSLSAMIKDEDKFKEFTIVNRVVKPVAKAQLETILTTQENNLLLFLQEQQRSMACSETF